MALTLRDRGYVVITAENADEGAEATRTVELHVTAILEKSGNPSRAAIVSAFWRPLGR